MSVIWYLLHCQEKDEWNTLNNCSRSLLQTGIKDAFILTYDRMRRFQGEWHMESRIMFPACIFLESNDKKKLAEDLRRSGSMAELIKKYGPILPVKKSVEIFLKSLCGEAHHLSMSKGVIRDGVTQITEGPLRGMEERIYRIDRHKRLARLEVSKSESVLAGLEIVEKS